MSRSTRIAAVHIALVAMLLRAFVPAGWMPNVTGGPAPLILCTGTGLVAVTFDADGKPVKQVPLKSEAAHHGVCPFGAAAHLALPEAGKNFAPSLHAVRLAQTLRLYRVAMRETRHSPQAARAPPLRA